MEAGVMDPTSLPGAYESLASELADAAEPAPWIFLGMACLSSSRILLIFGSLPVSFQATVSSSSPLSETIMGAGVMDPTSLHGVYGSLASELADPTEPAIPPTAKELAKDSKRRVRARVSGEAGSESDVAGEATAMYLDMVPASSLFVPLIPSNLLCSCFSTAIILFEHSCKRISIEPSLSLASSLVPSSLADAWQDNSAKAHSEGSLEVRPRPELHVLHSSQERRQQESCLSRP
eukprot:CAMPEP_0115681560 /NCGR_PEP_ID=MMETSP0272-20121206/57389_1 /TAXON_ID=71861 /ORGANISM="Scrippsiella trochoidea, Strain CCMP3099" /LENGTH=234 /DNA_ID=CAMNT_0003120883 /DNA_START=347 /DNA_END=1049 /DNA_ORIENTATION=+